MLRGCVLILWGFWGLSIEALMYQVLQGPHMIFLCGDGPHKIRGPTPPNPTRKNRQNRQNLTKSPQIKAYVPTFKSHVGTLYPAPRMA